MLNGKKPARQVIVAIIGSGVDYEHPELKMWPGKIKKRFPGMAWMMTKRIREYIRLRKNFESEKDGTILVKKRAMNIGRKS